MMDRLLENDTFLKILSVLVAIFLWLQVDGVTSHPVLKQETLGPMPVQVSLPRGSDLSLITLKPNTVSVVLEGSSKSLDGVKRDDVSAFVILKGVTNPGTYTLPMAAAVPSGTRTLNIVPDQVTVSVDEIGSRRMPVTVSAQGSVPSKYEVTSMVPSVGEVTLSGPKQDLNQVQRVVATVPVAGHTQGFEDQTLLVPEAASGTAVSHVEVNPPMVSVDSVIRLKPPEVTIGVVLRVSGHPAAGYTITSIAVTPNHLTITGPATVIQKITTIYTSAIDVSGVTGAISGTIPVKLPPGVSSVSGSDLVHVAVNVAPK